MATRLFFQENFGYETPDAIIAIDESDIQPTYCSYDNFIKADNGLDEDYFEENEDGSFRIDNSDVPSWIENQIAGAWDFESLTTAQRDAIIEASEYEIDHSDEADSSTIYEISFNPETGFSFEEDEPTQIGEHYTYWDGHNHKTIQLTSDFNETFYTEVTDQYPNWEEKKYIGSTRWVHGRRTCFYALQNEDNSYTLVQEKATQWQGEADTFRILNGDEALEALLNYCNDDDVKKYFGEWLNQAIEYAKADLRKGETLTWDEENILVFSYRGEDYHFATKQITDSFLSAIKKAREAIRSRRVEAVNEKFARNNYEGVLSLPLQKIYVERTDSTNAGNCEEYTDQLIMAIRKNEGIQGSFALRADKLLQYRDDNYSRRAILHAYRAGHIIRATD